MTSIYIHIEDDVPWENATALARDIADLMATEHPYLDTSELRTGPPPFRYFTIHAEGKK